MTAFNYLQTHTNQFLQMFVVDNNGKDPKIDRQLLLANIISIVANFYALNHHRGN